MPMTGPYIIGLLARLAIVLAVLCAAVEGTPTEYNHAIAADNGDGLPAYEEQLAVWPAPSDEEELLLAEGGKDGEQMKATDGGIPVFEEQQIVFPLHPFDEDSVEEEGEEAPVAAPLPEGVSGPAVHVLERFQALHENGTREYKLVLSNGLVSYKKLYPKVVAGQLVTVQEGYDSVPVPGQLDQFHTRFYIADERGNNVYKVQLSSGPPDHAKLQLRPKAGAA